MRLTRSKNATPAEEPTPTGGPERTPVVPPVPARRRPGMIGLGVAAVALSGLGGWWVINGADNTHPVVMVARDIRAGQPITADQLTVTRIHGGEGLATLSNLDQAVGKRAVSDLSGGTLLNPSTVVDELAVGPGYSTVTIALKHGSTPASGLRAGQQVRIVTQLTANAAPNAKAEAWKGNIVAVGSQGDDQMTVVDVSTTSADAAQIATHQPGTMSIVLDPPTGAPSSTTPKPAPQPAKPAPQPTKPAPKTTTSKAG